MIVGPVINTFPVRVQVTAGSSQKSVRLLAQELQVQISRSIGHESLPLTEIQKQVQA